MRGPVPEPTPVAPACARSRLLVQLPERNCSSRPAEGRGWLCSQLELLCHRLCPRDVSKCLIIGDERDETLIMIPWMAMH